MNSNRQSKVRSIGKWLLGTITSAGIIIGIIWVGLQHGSRQYNLGYDQGHGDTQVLRQLIEHKDSEITALNDRLKLLGETLDSFNCENAKLQAQLKSNVIVSDTIIFVKDAISLFGGHVTIQCNYADFAVSHPSANITGIIFEDGEQKRFWLEGEIGAQSVFKFESDKYLVVVLGCREYEKGPGVKIAVYKY
jgi:hypothetical protein